MKPHRVQLRRVKGWRMPQNTVVVARQSRWGNPYMVWQNGGLWYVAWEYGDEKAFHWREKAFARAVKLYRNGFGRCHDFLADVRRELRGKNLACWCRLDEPCHADILLKWANA